MSAAPSRWARVRRWVREHYMKMDPRTAGLYRIGAGFLLCADSLRHWALARTYYSNDGVLSNHWLLFKPSSPYHFSLFSAFSSIEEVHVAFALSFACYFFLLIGWHARVFAVLSFVAVTSMDSRLLLVENGGYVVVNLVAMYAALLPVDRRFSVDAWLRSWREHRERRVEHLQARTFTIGRDEPFVSMASLLVVTNLAFVYFFNTVNKSGNIWRAGDTVHFVLHLDRMVTGLAVVIRELVPSFLLKPVTWATLSVEAFLFFLIMSPRGRRLTRPMAMVGIFFLHLSFGLMMRLGPFSWFMVGWSLSLLTPIQWAGLAAIGGRRARPAKVLLAPRSPLALAAGRVLARLDAYRNLTFEPAAPDASALMTVKRDGDAEAMSGTPETARAIAEALPFGAWWWRPASALSLGLLPKLPGWLERRRDHLERRFFASPVLPDDDASPLTPDPPSPLRQRVRWLGRGAREIALGWLTLCFILQAWMENKCIPPVIKPTQPEIMKATTHRFRTLQGWGMFSPNPIQEDGVLTIDAYTRGGRRIDPLTGDPPVMELGPVKGMGLGQIEQDYGNRIRADRNEVYRKELEGYLLRWHQITGNPDDEIVAFDAYWVTDKCPRPGEQTSTEGKAIAIRTWRKSGYRPPPGFPPIPPQPKVESAGP